MKPLSLKGSLLTGEGHAPEIVIIRSIDLESKARRVSRTASHNKISRFPIATVP